MPWFRCKMSPISSCCVNTQYPGACTVLGGYRPFGRRTSGWRKYILGEENGTQALYPAPLPVLFCFLTAKMSAGSRIPGSHSCRGQVFGYCAGSFEMSTCPNLELPEKGVSNGDLSRSEWPGGRSAGIVFIVVN